MCTTLGTLGRRRIWINATASPRQRARHARSVVIVGHESQDVKPSRSAIPKSLAQVHVVSTTLEESHDLIKEEFDRFLVHIETAAREMRQKEEQSVVGD
ncbi:hypothetical protein GUITHDRAFT_109704 [Guillardia theta CCMP2712]|uniref:Uncharacterized protein n=1 Tax=Guillardia theta (strain CCMP2712) TaxID=905079 RepID=L1J846_GUITC|nr:hypothetical protein GUITHDRAFT_109704 [Guillardia theta CCMP2712]EKX44245.1 hypothetical protein GUITHDRAFT_109704 [Guillardia theta CCMP2712]|eukprot:XP_005831225.1 hypothetical protein GUITHDRAFT_109704 [Guillardia theta CCMP2712]